MKYILSLSLAFFFCLGLSTSVQAQASQNVEIKVKGIGCSKDVTNIKNNVAGLAGVAECSVVKKGPTTTFKVVYNPKQVTIEKIHAAIENTPDCLNPNDRPHRVSLR